MGMFISRINRQVQNSSYSKKILVRLTWYIALFDNFGIVII